jgi:hypothetical protein
LCFSSFACLCYNILIGVKRKNYMPDDPQPPKIPYYPGRYIGMGVGAGLVFGAALGFFTRDMLMGVVVGAVGGAFIGWILDRRRRKKDNIP